MFRDVWQLVAGKHGDLSREKMTTVAIAIRGHIPTYSYKGFVSGKKKILESCI